MNKEEKVAEAYLKSLAVSDLRFEPDGNVPPDFAFDANKIGIEVRRLNENFESESGSEGLEQVYIPTVRGTEAVLREFDDASAITSYGTILSFQRPLDRKLKFKSALRSKLSEFLTSGDKSRPTVHSIGKNISIKIIPSGSNGGRVFWAMGERDEDSGGWVGELAIQNINLCIQEKSRKIANYHGNYCDWWLLLVDAIGIDLMYHEMKEVRSAISLSPAWSKLIVIDYSGKELLTIGAP